MPIPYVNVGSDILQSYIAGRQMAMARQQMMMEQQRLQEEKRYHDLQQQHNLASLTEEAKWHAQNYDILNKAAQRAQKEQEFTQQGKAREDLQKGLYGLTPGQPGIDTTSPEAVGASLLNAPTSLAPTAPMELPAMPGVPAQQIPTSTQSPADLTTGVAQISPTTSGAISGTPLGPTNPPGVPTQLTPGLTSGPAVQTLQTPGQDINVGGVIIPAAQARAIPIKPPLGDAEKLQMEASLNKEARLAEIAATAASNKNHWDQEHEDRQAQISATKLEAMARLGETKFQHETQRKQEAIKEFDRFSNSKFEQTIGTRIPHAMGIVEMVHNTNGMGTGEGTGINDADMVDTLRQLKGFPSPFPNPQSIQIYLKSLIPNADKWIQNAKGLTDPAYAAFTPEGRRAMADLIEKTAREQNNIREAQIKNTESKARAFYPTMPSNFTNDFVERYNLSTPKGKLTEVK